MIDSVTQKLHKRLHSALRRTSTILKLKYCLGMPSYLNVEVTNHCNLSCVLCPTGNAKLNRPSGMMKVATFQKILNEVGSYLDYMMISAWGEPFLNNKLPEMLSLINNNFFVHVCTNGTLFPSEKICSSFLETGKTNLLTVALGAADPETYAKYRKKGNYNDVLKGLAIICAMKREMRLELPILELQFILTKDNENQVDQVREIAYEVGVDRFSIKTVGDISLQSFNSQEKLTEFEENYLPKQSKYRRYENGELDRETVAINYCSAVYNASFIYWNGDVVPCCVDYSNSIKLGNILEKKRFIDIWNGLPYRKLRRNIRLGKNLHACCKVCPTKKAKYYYSKENLKY